MSNTVFTIVIVAVFVGAGLLGLLIAHLDKTDFDG